MRKEAMPQNEYEGYWKEVMKTVEDIRNAFRLFPTWPYKADNGVIWQRPTLRQYLRISELKRVRVEFGLTTLRLDAELNVTKNKAVNWWTVRTTDELSRDEWEGIVQQDAWFLRDTIDFDPWNADQEALDDLWAKEDRIRNDSLITAVEREREVERRTR